MLSSHLKIPCKVPPQGFSNTTAVYYQWQVKYQLEELRTQTDTKTYSLSNSIFRCSYLLWCHKSKGFCVAHRLVTRSRNNMQTDMIVWKFAGWGSEGTIANCTLFNQNTVKWRERGLLTDSYLHDKILSGNKPCQLWIKVRFRDHLCLHHQGNDVKVYCWWCLKTWLKFPLERPLANGG
jgi:hypothetical protein